MSRAERVLSHSLSGIFMLAAAKEIIEIVQGSKIIELSPEIILINALLHWIALISFLIIVVNWIKNCRKPPK